VLNIKGGYKVKRVTKGFLVLFMVFTLSFTALASGGFTYMGHIASLDTTAEGPFGEIWRKFQELYPQYDLTYVGNAGTDAQMTKLKLAAESNQLPDIFWSLDATAVELYEAGYLLDLTEFMETHPEVSANLASNMVFQRDNDIYGLAFELNIQGFWYNKQIFREHGIPEPVAGTTFEELLDMVADLNSKGIVPIANGAQSPYSCWAIMGCLARYGYFDRIDAITAGEDSWDNEDFLAFFKSLKVLADAGAFAKNVTTNNYFDAVALFESGGAAMMDAGSWLAGSEGVLAMGDDIGFWWGPTFADGVVNELSIQIPSAPICVSSAVANDPAKKEAVYAFLNFYYSQMAAEIAVNAGFIPVVTLEKEVKTDIPSQQALLDAVAVGWTSIPVGPDLILSTAMQNQLHDSIYGVIGGIYTPEQALRLLDAAQQEELLYF
jgi:raffinose/stachyose/melibiose transport system substrate-binding protein